MRRRWIIYGSPQQPADGSERRGHTVRAGQTRTAARNSAQDSSNGLPTASWSWMRKRSLANCRARFWQNRVAGETQRINHDEETFFMLRFHSSSLLNRLRAGVRDQEI